MFQMIFIGFVRLMNFQRSSHGSGGLMKLRGFYTKLPPHHHGFEIPTQALNGGLYSSDSKGPDGKETAGNGPDNRGLDCEGPENKGSDYKGS